MEALVLTGIILSENEAFVALCPELDVASQGSTLEEARAMLLEAVSLYLESAFENGLPYLRPIPPADNPRRSSPERVVEVFPLKVELTVKAYA